MKTSRSHLICSIKFNRAPSRFTVIKAIIFLLAFFLNGQIFLSSQSIGINNDKTAPDPSAMLDIKSADKGVLIPRLTNEEMELIEDPAEGLLIFNIDENDLYFFRNEDWIQVGTNGGSNSQWTAASGGIYNNTKVGVGSGGDFYGKFNVSSTLERTSMDIRNFYEGTEVSRGINVSLAQNVSSQYGISTSITPNDNTLLPAVGYSASMSTVGGGEGKPVIGFDAFLPLSLLGTKYGLRVYSPGLDSWAAHLTGRTFIADKTYIGDIGAVEAASWGALTIHNDVNIAKFASLHLRNSANATSYYGLYNNFIASTTSSANYGSALYVSGGSVGKPVYGSFISLGSAVGQKTGIYVNAPGSDNWASFFNGRTYISETLLVGATVGKAGYQVSVDGKVACEEVLVEMSQDWPDYVFESSYDLLSLDLLEGSIRKNGHLPGIPSAKEIEKDGLQLGDMQKRMMEKIEELTLYIIDLNKKNQELERRLEKVENKKSGL